MILYGRNPVHEALRGRRAGGVEAVWATSGAARERWLKDAPVSVVDATEVAERCGSQAHQGVCALVGPYPYVSGESLLATPVPLLLALDQIQDPQNLGSICRTAECAGVSGVVVPERRAATVTPAVCKASAGAVEHLAIATVRNLADFLGDAKRVGCWCYGACTDRGAASYLVPDYSGPLVLVLGSEGKGLRPRVAAACDQLVALPMHGAIASLGVSAAAAALLYHVLHDRERLDKR